jgi:deoxyribonuclease IV
MNPTTLLLGAHVSTAGGMANAVVRAIEIEATAIQIFTRQPNRWADRPISDGDAAAFRTGCREAGVRYAVSHDSYLINLATHDPVLRERSMEAFREELRRAALLGLDGVVSHPGNATDGDRPRAIAQNAALAGQLLDEVGGDFHLLLETTAGSGQVLGADFAELAALLEAIPEPARGRVGVCLDTCHVWAAGYDLREACGEVLDAFDATIGLDRLRLLHLNDSQHPRGSRRDRHAGIGEGALGEEAFRALMNEPRLAGVPKVIETPKGDDHAAADRANLGRLRSYLT